MGETGERSRGRLSLILFGRAWIQNKTGIMTEHTDKVGHEKHEKHKNRKESF